MTSVPPGFTPPVAKLAITAPGLAQVHSHYRRIGLVVVSPRVVIDQV